MSGSNKHFYEFDEFRLDAENHTLWRRGELVQIFPKALEILILLVERKGEVVGREELLENVWRDTFVEEANITYTVSQLRKTLGSKDYIQTVPKRGYRFTAPVKVTGNGQPEFFTNAPSTENNDAKKTLPVYAPRLRASTASLVWFGIGVVSLLVFGFTADKLLPKRSENKTSAPAETVRFQKLTFSGDIFFPILAPDGKSFAYTRDGSIFLQEIGSETAARLEVEDEKIFGFLQFAPDGNSIYFRNRRTIDLAGNVLEVSRAGGAARTVAEKVWSGFSFSPAGGREMAFIRFYPDENESALIVKNLESGAERKLVVRRSPNGFSYPNGFPAWSPDAKKIAVAVQNSQETPASEIAIIDVESGGIEEIKTPGFRQIEQPAWTPDGAALLVVAREKDVAFQLWRVSIPSGEIRRITNDTNIYRALSLSADGTRLLARQFTTYAHVWTAKAETPENARQITFGNLNRDGMAGLVWTADGNLIYATRILGNVDLWLLRPNDGARRQLTVDGGEYNENPALSADNKHVFFNSNRKGSKAIWRMDANGENQTQITSDPGVIELHPTVSADGRWLYYLRRDGKETAVWRKSLTDGQAEPLRLGRKFSFDNFLLLSPDGKHLAFHNRTEKIDETAVKQTMQIVIVSTENATAAPKVFNLAVSPVLICWTNGGANFDYAEYSDGTAKIWRQSLDEKTPPQLILKLPANERIFRFAWSADGKNLALSRGQQQNDAVLLTNF